MKIKLDVELLKAVGEKMIINAFIDMGNNDPNEFTKRLLDSLATVYVEGFKAGAFDPLNVI